MKSLWMAAALSLVFQGAADCHQPDPKPATAAAETSATLVQGMGSLHHPVSTRHPEAQKFFDQGLSFTYAFNHAEAIRSFERAAQLDPQMAMAYWGIALALGPNINAEGDAEKDKAAHDAVQKALALAAKGPEHERRYIEALARRYSILPQADRKTHAVAYASAMGELARHYPDDLDAATLYAEAVMNLRPWRLWTADGKPEEGTLDIVAALESVLRRDPGHIGAIHYYIHAVEASPQPERALPYASSLLSLAPAAGHLAHMPAHIYQRTGDYAAAARSNEEAAKADEAYVRSRGVTGAYALLYYGHNLHFLAVSWSMAGRFADSFAAASKLEAHAGQHVRENPVVEVFLPTGALVLSKFRRWEDALKVPRPESALALATTYWHFARGMAFAATGDIARAEREHAEFLIAEKGISAELASAGGMAADSVRRVADHVLGARIAGAKRDSKTEIERLRKAVEIEDSLAYDEPPPWFLPVRESLGGALARSGQPAEAERVFRADLERNRRNGRSLFGLSEVLKAQNRPYEAALVRAQFERAWKDADTRLRLEDL